MKKFNLLLTALMVLFLGSTVLNAQNTKDPWAVTVGAHAVDYTSVRGVGNEFFNHHNYTIVPPLSKVSIIRNLNRWFDVDLTASVGEVDNKDRKSTRLNSSHVAISYAVFCLKKKKQSQTLT